MDSVERVSSSRGDGDAGGADVIDAVGDEVAAAEDAEVAEAIGSVHVGEEADDAAGAAGAAAAPPGPDGIGSGSRRTPLELRQ